ncbi:MAG: family 16 glycosylhydrolase [Chitinophagales bacterium]
MAKLARGDEICIFHKITDMRFYVQPSICLLLMIFCFGFSKDHKAPDWSLVWSDEFNYAGLPDSSKWKYDFGADGWGNNELEFYTMKRKENARVENGNLVIEARKEDYNGSHYTSARLVTRGKADWKYGKFEIRAKLPRGLGTWPAIWMLGSKSPMKWPDDGEIDIMEHVGYDPGVIHASIHCKDFNHVIGTQKTAVTGVADCMDNFHVYGLEWDEKSILISIDGRNYFKFFNEHYDYGGWPFNQPMHILLNLAIGGNWGGQKGVDDGIFPQSMLVDYVRVYQRK